MAGVEGSIGGSERGVQERIQLPVLKTEGGMPLYAALRSRRSVREFAPTPLTLDQISRMLWAAQGVTHGDGLRTAASAGALYPLELALVVGESDELPAGVYRYRPHRHGLERAVSTDVRSALAAACGGQECVGDAPAVLVFAAAYRRTTRKYGERGLRYVHIEAGLAAQGVSLAAVGLGLGTVVIGAFDDTKVSRLIASPAHHRPVVLMCIGKERA